MIEQLRFWHHGVLNRPFLSWLPIAEKAMVTLRPMPWELDAKGHPTARFWRHLCDLGAQTWLAASGEEAMLPRDPETALVSALGRARLKPLGRLMMVTELAMIERESLRLSHLVFAPTGMVVASATSQIALAGAETDTQLTLHSAIAPRRPAKIARPANAA